MSLDVGISIQQCVGNIVHHFKSAQSYSESKELCERDREISALFDVLSGEPNIFNSSSSGITKQNLFFGTIQEYALQESDHADFILALLGAYCALDIPDFSLLFLDMDEKVETKKRFAALCFCHLSQKAKAQIAISNQNPYFSFVKSCECSITLHSLLSMMAQPTSSAEEAKISCATPSMQLSESQQLQFLTTLGFPILHMIATEYSGLSKSQQAEALSAIKTLTMDELDIHLRNEAAYLYLALKTPIMKAAQSTSQGPSLEFLNDAVKNGDKVNNSNLTAMGSYFFADLNDVLRIEEQVAVKLQLFQLYYLVILIDSVHCDSVFSILEMKGFKLSDQQDDEAEAKRQLILRRELKGNVSETIAFLLAFAKKFDFCHDRQEEKKEEIATQVYLKNIVDSLKDIIEDPQLVTELSLEQKKYLLSLSAIPTKTDEMELDPEMGVHTLTLPQKDVTQAVSPQDLLTIALNEFLKMAERAKVKKASIPDLRGSKVESLLKIWFEKAQMQEACSAFLSQSESDLKSIPMNERVHFYCQIAHHSLNRLKELYFLSAIFLHPCFDAFENDDILSLFGSLTLSESTFLAFFRLNQTAESSSLIYQRLSRLSLLLMKHYPYYVIGGPGKKLPVLIAYLTLQERVDLILGDWPDAARIELIEASIRDNTLIQTPSTYEIFLYCYRQYLVRSKRDAFRQAYEKLCEDMLKESALRVKILDRLTEEKATHCDLISVIQWVFNAHFDALNRSLVEQAFFEHACQIYRNHDRIEDGVVEIFFGKHIPRVVMSLNSLRWSLGDKTKFLSSLFLLKHGLKVSDLRQKQVKYKNAVIDFLHLFSLNDPEKFVKKFPSKQDRLTVISTFSEFIYFIGHENLNLWLDRDSEDCVVQVKNMASNEAFLDINCLLKCEFESEGEWAWTDQRELIQSYLVRQMEADVLGEWLGKGELPLPLQAKYLHMWLLGREEKDSNPDEILHSIFQGMFSNSTIPCPFVLMNHLLWSSAYPSLTNDQREAFIQRSLRSSTFNLLDKNQKLSIAEALTSPKGFHTLGRAGKESFLCGLLGASPFGSLTAEQKQRMVHTLLELKIEGLSFLSDPLKRKEAAIQKELSSLDFLSSDQKQSIVEAIIRPKDFCTLDESGKRYFLNGLLDASLFGPLTNKQKQSIVRAILQLGIGCFGFLTEAQKESLISVATEKAEIVRKKADIGSAADVGLDEWILEDQVSLKYLDSSSLLGLLKVLGRKKGSSHEQKIKVVKFVFSDIGRFRQLIMHGNPFETYLSFLSGSERLEFTRCILANVEYFSCVMQNQPSMDKELLLLNVEELIALYRQKNQTRDNRKKILIALGNPKFTDHKELATKILHDIPIFLALQISAPHSAHACLETLNLEERVELCCSYASFSEFLKEKKPREYFHWLVSQWMESIFPRITSEPLQQLSSQNRAIFLPLLEERLFKKEAVIPLKVLVGYFSVLKKEEQRAHVIGRLLREKPSLFFSVLFSSSENEITQWIGHYSHMDSAIKLSLSNYLVDGFSAWLKEICGRHRQVPLTVILNWITEVTNNDQDATLQTKLLRRLVEHEHYLRVMFQVSTGSFEEIDPLVYPKGNPPPAKNQREELAHKVTDVLVKQHKHYSVCTDVTRLATFDQTYRKLPTLLRRTIRSEGTGAWQIFLNWCGAFIRGLMGIPDVLTQDLLDEMTKQRSMPAEPPSMSSTAKMMDIGMSRAETKKINHPPTGRSPLVSSKPEISISISSSSTEKAYTPTSLNNPT